MIFEENNIRFNLLDVLKHDRTDFTLISNIRSLPVISFRTSGSGYFEATGEHTDYIQKSVLYLPPNVRYTQHSDREELIAVILEIYNYESTEIDFLHGCDSKTELYFEQLYETWTQKAPDYYYKSMSIMNKIFAHLHITSGKKIQNERFEKIQRSVDYINKNFTNPYLTLSEIAKISDMSEVYFRRIFKERFECSPLDYISRLRLDKAKLLLEGGYSVKEVAVLSGFNSYSYFTQFFKTNVGIYPAAYKRML